MKTMTLGSPRSSLSERILPSHRQKTENFEKEKRPSVKPQTPNAVPYALMSDLFPVKNKPRGAHSKSIREERFKRKSESKLQTGTPKKKRERKSDE